MPKRKDIKTILVIGSGPIIIGQAAEFDYAGTQACLSLREEGYEVILVNSNPATIMTDKEIVDKVYIEPLTVEFLSKDHIVKLCPFLCSKIANAIPQPPEPITDIFTILTPPVKKNSSLLARFLNE